MGNNVASYGGGYAHHIYIGRNHISQVWGNDREAMTYDNALKAMIVASSIPMGLNAGQAIRAGLSAGSISQVAGGITQGMGAVSIGQGATWTPTPAGIAFDQSRRDRRLGPSDHLLQQRSRRFD